MTIGAPTSQPPLHSTPTRIQAQQLELHAEQAQGPHSGGSHTAAFAASRGQLRTHDRLGVSGCSIAGRGAQAGEQAGRPVQQA